jgi:hypothetical protein
MKILAVSIILALLPCFVWSTPSPPPPVHPDDDNAMPTFSPPTVPTDTETEPYDITLSGPALANEEDRQVIVQAASRWTHVIPTGVEDVETTGLRPITPSCPYPQMVDDILVCITFEFIDGPGGVLAAAGPDSFRNDGGLPVAGAMIVDTADIPALKTNNEYLDTITHEMGHILGEELLNESRG